MRTPSTLQTSIRVRTVQDRNLSSAGGRQADIVIEPDVSQVQLTDFRSAGETALLGQSAAAAALPQILQKLHTIDPDLFPSPDPSINEERRVA